MIRVFRSQVGKRDLKDLQERIRFAGWRILGITRHEIDDLWLVRCANREWFDALPYESQARVVLGRPAHD